MKYYTYLNNYQMGSYSHSVMAMRIVSEERINSKATKVIWDLDASEMRLLQRALGCKKLKPLEEV